MFSKLMVWWFGHCGWYGHDFKVVDVIDSEEFVGRYWMDDCMETLFRCSVCGGATTEFLGWGTVAENKPNVEELKRWYESSN